MKLLAHAANVEYFASHCTCPGVLFLFGKLAAEFVN